MRLFGLLGALGALILGGAVVLAAAPAPSTTPIPSASAHATATPKGSPSASPSPSSSPTPSSSSAAKNAWQANVQPLNVAGQAMVRRLSNGDGTIRLKLTGLVNELPWTVDVDGGTTARPDESHEIAFKSGDEVVRIASDSIRIHLTKAEMAAFVRAQRREGVVIMVSDGTRLSAAEIAKS